LFNRNATQLKLELKFYSDCCKTEGNKINCFFLFYLTWFIKSLAFLQENSFPQEVFEILSVVTASYLCQVTCISA